MCGIVGTIARSGPVLEGLIDGLRTLEYRGYDSSGVAVVQSGRIAIRRSSGRLAQLEKILAGMPLSDEFAGIGHTRWATHGPPTDLNAHPHSEGRGELALVHNGIIENYLELKDELIAEGHKFSSDTDTEVLAHLIHREMAKGTDPTTSVRNALEQVKGYYAIAMLTMDGGEPLIVAACAGPPLALCKTEDSCHLASDTLALLPYSKQITYLEEGDVAELRPGSFEIVGGDGQTVTREEFFVDWDATDTGMGEYAHYMLKEIHEQPDVLGRSSVDRMIFEQGDVDFGNAEWSNDVLRDVSRVQIIACGTALHAGIVMRYLIEGLVGIPVDFDYASEFRYRKPVIVPDTLALGISQSGETADTLAAMRLARRLGARAVALCNAPGSTLVRESQAAILTQAGPEIGVASTKAFVAQLVSGFLLALRLGRETGKIDAERGRELLAELRQVRPVMERLLSDSEVERIRELASRAKDAKGFLFLGRGINYPVALEGALKLKEISYMHAEGYPAGEMKHGPIALVEPDMWTVVINSKGDVSDKVRSNIEQIKARGGYVVCVGDDEESLRIADEGIHVPSVSESLSPLLNIIPLQLLSYFVAKARGCDVDKPRNLAKSVTVE